jgi:phosphatidylethanolamine/phosphatidyl-N-methylethanolamine N-methyltransferase
MDEILSRNRLIDEYYNSYHNDLQYGGLQGLGQKIMNRWLENFWGHAQPKITLEVGFGSGQHLAFVRCWPSEIYIGLDLRVGEDLHAPHCSRQKVAVIEGDVQCLPFPDKSIDRVVMTCLLHHLDDPLKALVEISRVLEDEGEVSILLPTDPGILNRTIKQFTVHRKAMKSSSYNSKLVYALDHRNHIHGLIQIISSVFSNDQILFHYFPLSFFHTWNFNLFVVVNIKRSL